MAPDQKALNQNPNPHPHSPVSHRNYTKRFHLPIKKTSLIRKSFFQVDVRKKHKSRQIVYTQQMLGLLKVLLSTCYPYCHITYLLVTITVCVSLGS